MFAGGDAALFVVVLFTEGATSIPAAGLFAVGAAPFTAVGLLLKMLHPILL